LWAADRGYASPIDDHRSWGRDDDIMTDDGFAELEQEHRDIEAQLQAVLGEDDAPVVRELCDQLTSHAAREDAQLYPVVRRWVDDGDDLADRAQQESATIATMVAELSDSVTPERLPELVTQLRDAVSAHIEFHEAELLPALREAGVDLRSGARRAS
jgi:hypothetical protein